MEISVNATIVNESTSNIARNAIRIFLQNGITYDHIRTFPIETHPRNSMVLSLLKDEMPPYTKTAYLGIGFVSYENIDLIQFTSTFKSFPLSRGDEFAFYFEDGEKIVYKLPFDCKREGSVYRNTHLIKDAELDILKNNYLKYWKITNHEKNISMIGGFTYNEKNTQYCSERTGKKLLKLMAKNVQVAKRKFETQLLS